MSEATLFAGCKPEVAAGPDGRILAIDLEGTDRKEIVARLVRGGVGVETVMSRHRLEDAFLSMLGENE